MIKKINSNPNIKNFFLYCGTNLVYGGVITSLGPIIPYFAFKQGLSQTDYSILFFARAMGFFLMGFGIKILEKYFKLHSLIIIGCAGIAINFSIFAYCQSMFWKSFFVFLGSLSTCVFQISGNVALLVAHTNNDQQFWVQITHGIYGVGGLLGPFIVYIFQLNSYLVMSIAILITIPFYFFLSSPQSIRLENLQQIMGQRKSQNIQIKQINDVDITKIQIIKEVPKNIQIFLSIAFFLYIGIECSYGGWISSYAVLTGVSTKQAATSYCSLFWISVTTCRFIFACFGGKISTKIIRSLQFCIIVLIISCILVLIQSSYLAILISSLIFGIGVAPIYPLYFSIAGQFGMQLQVSQTANICVCASLGQAILSMIIGYLMGLLTPNWFFYGLFIIVFLLYLISVQTINQFKKNNLNIVLNFDDNRAKGTELKQKILN